MKRMFAPDAVYLEDRLENLYSAIQLPEALAKSKSDVLEPIFINAKHLEMGSPVDFSISYEIRKHGELLYLDVDLPEIED
jgi:HSP20 family molecular chaperone IbpA